MDELLATMSNTPETITNYYELVDAVQAASGIDRKTIDAILTVGRVYQKQQTLATFDKQIENARYWMMRDWPFSKIL